MIIAMIVAMDRNRLIGADGDMPWRLPAELRYFRSVTMGKPIIMGRKTFEAIGRPLPGRHNIILTRNRSYAAPGCSVVHSMEEALQVAGKVEEVMVIGGSAVYRSFLPHAHRLYLTCIEATFEGDTYFPVIDRAQWRTIWQEFHEQDETNPHAFHLAILEKRDSSPQ